MACVAAGLIALVPAASFGQACNGTLQVTNEVLQDPNVNGSIDTVRITIGSGVIDPTGGVPNPVLEVSEVFFKLDCDNSNILACPDDGAVIAYVTDPVVTTCGVTWTATTDGSTPHPGGTADNTVVFVANTPVVIPPNQGEFCYLEFQVQKAADFSNDATPFTAEQLAGYQMANCTNGGASAASNSSGLPFARLPERLCRDNIDNDLDGRTDCADPDCFDNLPCGVPAPTLDPRALLLLVLSLTAVAATGLGIGRRDEA